MPITVPSNNDTGPAKAATGLTVPGQKKAQPNLDLDPPVPEAPPLDDLGLDDPIVSAPVDPVSQTETGETPDWLLQGSTVEGSDQDNTPDWLSNGSTVDETANRPQLDFNSPAANPPGDFKPTTEETFLHDTSVGRVLDAVGEGLSDGYGTSALGLSEESTKVLTDFGLIGNKGSQIAQPLRTFNEALIRPSAKVLDFALRGIEATGKGIAKGVGQTALELGEDPGKAKRLTRDVLSLFETVGIIAAAAPPSAAIRANAARRVAGKEAEGTPEQLRRVEAETVHTRIPEDTPPAPAAIETATGDVVRPSVRTNNINLNRISAGDDVKEVIRDTATANAGFQDARRGVLTLDETENMADALGMTSKELLKRKLGQTFNAEELLAARSLLVDSAADVRRLAKQAEGGSDEDVVAFLEATTRHSAIQEQVAGLTAEAGRALSQFRILASETRDAKAISELLDATKGRADASKMAEAIGKLETPGQVSKFINDARNATTSEKFLEAWINALLSGPQTHLANVTGNLITAVMAVPETALASGIGKALTAFKGRQHSERVLLGESVGRLTGILQGARDGVVAGAKAYIREVPTTPGTKIDVKRPTAIPSAKIEGRIGEAFENLTGAKLEVGGKQVRIPSRLLQAEDELFKAIGRRQEINALAFRKADSEGLSGQAFRNRVADLVQNPTDDMIESANKYAQTITFQNPLGEVGNKVLGLSNAHPLAKVVLPFVRTPINIVKFAGKRTPLGVLSKEVRDNIKGKNGAIARDQELARIGFGSMVATATVSLAAEGLITGSGPSDPEQRSLLRASGWQPNSIKIGDTYYSYARLEPLALILGIAADMQQFSEEMTQEEADEVGTALLGSIAKNLTSKTWLRGPSELIQALTDPDRYGERWLQRLAATAVPTGVAQVARAQDPVLRDARTLLDNIKARIPGLSTSVLPRRDIFGLSITREGSLGPDVASTVYTSRDKNDPVMQELIALQMTPGRLPRTVSGVELTPEEYDRYQVDAGTALRAHLEVLVGIEDWEELPEFVRRDTISKAFKATRDQARKMLLLDPDFNKRVVDKKLDDLQGKLGVRRKRNGKNKS